MSWRAIRAHPKRPVVSALRRTPSAVGVWRKETSVTTDATSSTAWQTTAALIRSSSPVPRLVQFSMKSFPTRPLRIAIRSKCAPKECSSRLDRTCPIVFTFSSSKPSTTRSTSTISWICRSLWKTIRKSWLNWETNWRSIWGKSRLTSDWVSGRSSIRLWCLMWAQLGKSESP